MCRPPQPSELVADAAKEAAAASATAAKAADAAPKEEPLPYARTEHNKHFGVTEEQQGLILLVGLLAAGFATTRFDSVNTTVRLRDIGIPVSYTHLTLPTKRIV